MKPTEIKPVAYWLTDMDGVLVHEEQALPGGAEFIAALQQYERRYLVLTNNSIFTARDLRARLLPAGSTSRNARSGRRRWRRASFWPPNGPAARPT